MTSSFTVKTEIFEGPLDLLLSLVEKKKLFINEISLSQVTDDYIKYIQNVNQFPISESAQFILIASTLLLIKSRSLLPQLNLSQEEEQSIEELERRLKEYQKIKELSVHVKNMFGKNVLHTRSVIITQPVFAPDPQTNKEGMFEAIKRVIQSFPKKEIVAKAVIRKIVSLEEMMDQLTDRISKSLSFSFKEFAKHKSGPVTREEKYNIIVGFLALLELVKQGMIAVTQSNLFSDIDIETDKIDVPKYN